MLALATIVHAHHFLLGFSDASVGLYLYVADRWLHGNLPYLVAWEYKPPGLFAVFALALALTGERAQIAVALLATLATFATAMLLWNLAPLVDRSGAERSGRYAALFYVMLSPENEGFLGDSEVLLAPFATAAFLLACGERVTLRTALVAGLLAGCALQMKLSAAPILVVPALVMASRSRRPIALLAAYASVAIAPFVVAALVYARANALLALWDANGGATLRRITGLHRGIERENLVWFREQLRVLAPALELGLLALPARANANRLASWGWFGASLLSIVIVGEFYDRQFVLLEAPVALLGGIGLRALLETLRSRAVARAILAFVFLATFALHDYWETAQAANLAYRQGVRHEPVERYDSYERLLEALRRLPHPSLFIIQASPMLYADLGVPSPTRYPYTDHLLDPRMMAMTGRDGVTELARIFATHPTVVVTGRVAEPRFDPIAVRFVEARLARDYRPVETTDARTTIYVRASSPR